MSKNIKNILMYLLCFSLLIVNISLLSIKDIYAEKSSILFIGDSRVYGMSKYCDDASKYYFYCEGGVGVGFIDSNTLKSKLGSKMKDAVTNNLTSAKSGEVDLKSAIKDKGIKTIIYELGVNGCGENGDGSDKAIATMKKLKSETGCNVYFMTVMPGIKDKADENGMRISNTGINKYNKAVKKGIGSDINVIDTNKYVSDYKNWKDHCSDGVHYDKTLYNGVLKFVIGKIGSFDSSSSNSSTSDNSSTSNSSGSNSGSTSSYDGSALDNPVCDSGFENSFEGAEYYDVAIPYKLTLEEIGGYSTGGNGKMSDTDKGKKCGSRWNREGDHTSKSNGNYILYSSVRESSNITISDADSGYCVAKDTNGTEYYILALPKYFYNSSATIKWGTENRGQVIEIYFTDGKYIRCIIGDAKSTDHTNGGTGSYYTFSTLNYEQYANIYQAYAGETFEWFCKSGTSNKSPAEIAGSSGEASYVRMYNLNVTKDVPKLASGADSSAVGSKSSSGSNINTSTQSEQNTSTGYVGGYYKESDLGAWNMLCENNIQLNYLDNARRENLSQDNLTGLTNWERNVSNNKRENGFIAFIRHAVMLLGIFMIVWLIFIYIAYWFDRLNTIFYIDALSLLTFGKLHISDTEEECTFTVKNLGKTEKKTVNHKAILSICLIGTFFITLLITGTFYKILMLFVNFVLRILGQ